MSTELFYSGWSLGLEKSVKVESCFLLYMLMYVHILKDYITLVKCQLKMKTAKIY